MRKLISIVGTTAVGKTSFVLDLADFILQKTDYKGVDLISADSRQVYRGLEVVSGADVPDGFKRVENDSSYFEKDKIRIYGVSIVEPDEEWSLVHFQKLVREIIQKSWPANRLPIIVGGTALYHRHLLNLDKKLSVKPDNIFRKKAETMSITQLQEDLKGVDLNKFNSMNNSDKNNPRRLVRAIEIAADTSWKKNGSNKNIQLLEDKHCLVGLRNSLKKVEKKIKQRVTERLNNGALEEVKKLIRKYPDWSLPAFSAIGVVELKRLVTAEITRGECLNLWSLRELQYAKRQITWWKKDKRVQWFDSPFNQSSFPTILKSCLGS